MRARGKAHCAWGDHFVVGIPVVAMATDAVLPLVGIRVLPMLLFKF
jgi:hypothetical protein